MCLESIPSYLLLLHELSIGAIVDDVTTEDGGSERGVDLFGVHITKLAIEDELISLGAKVDGGLLAEENESEDVTILPAMNHQISN